MLVTVLRSLAAAILVLLLLPLTAVAAHAAPPDNDTPDGATVIPRLPTTLTQDTTEATVEALDDRLIELCVGGVPPALVDTVWYAYTARGTEGFTVDAGPGTTRLSGFVVTEGDPEALEVVACSGGDAVVPSTQAGTTYFVMAFAAEHVSAGTLEVTFAEILPTPEIAAGVDERAKVKRDGSVRLRGTYTCVGGDTVDSVQISLTVQQQLGSSLASVQGDVSVKNPRCNGKEHRWRVVAKAVPGFGDVPLTRGEATANVFARACNALECVSSQEAVTVQLRGRARH